MKPYVDYDEEFLPTLLDPKEAAGYLNAALEEGDPLLFLAAFYDVARAHGMQALAKSAKIHRVSLNKMLSKRGNPELKSLFKILDASGLKIRVEARAR
jgi:probable addiction module antidote protein